MSARSKCLGDSAAMHALSERPGGAMAVDYVFRNGNIKRIKRVEGLCKTNL